MSKAAAIAVSAMQTLVKALTGHPLHPLALRLPLPPSPELESMKQHLEEHGWYGDLTWTNKGELLDGRVRLWIWGQLGRSFRDIPAAQQLSIQADSALASYLRNIGKRQGWGLWRRAVAASVFAPDAHVNLPALRAICDAANGDVYDVLARLCATNDRYVAYALRLSQRSDTKRFGRALAGEEDAPAVKYIANAPPHGSRALEVKSSTIQVGQRWYRWFPAAKKIDLFLIDLRYPPMLGINFYQLAYWHHDRAHFVFLCPWDTQLEGAKPGDVHWNELLANISRFLGKSRNEESPLDLMTLKAAERGLSEVKPSGALPRRMVPTWCRVVVFSFEPNTVAVGSYKRLLKRDLFEPLDKDACREIVYQRLMRAFCRRRRNHVFVPYAADLDITPDRPPNQQAKSEMHTLHLLKRAAVRANVELIHYSMRENSYLRDTWWARWYGDDGR
jgi:hypothetical protein